jgi:hypothetical protein
MPHPQRYFVACNVLTAVRNELLAPPLLARVADNNGMYSFALRFMRNIIDKYQLNDQRTVCSLLAVASIGGKASRCHGALSRFCPDCAEKVGTIALVRQTLQEAAGTIGWLSIHAWSRPT